MRFAETSNPPHPSPLPPQRAEREQQGGESPTLPIHWPDCDAVADAALTPEKRFRAAALAGRSCFLTGMGGTGKTWELKRFIADVSNGVSGSQTSVFAAHDPAKTYRSDPGGRRVDVTAPTGVAALNAGGMTLHRFCGMLLGPAPGQSNEDYFGQLRRDPRRSILAGFNRVRRCEVLVIDEISMLPGRQLEFVEFLFRRLRGRGGRLFLVLITSPESGRIPCR